MLEIAVNKFNIPRANLGNAVYASTFYESITFSVKTLLKYSVASVFMNYDIMVIVILY